MNSSTGKNSSSVLGEKSKPGYDSLTEVNINIGTLVLQSVGQVSGQVTLSNESVHNGTDIYIPGTSYQAVSDVSGNYLITGIPEGTYTLYFGHAGYYDQSATTINVTANQEFVVDQVILDPIPEYKLGLKGDTGDAGEQGETGPAGDQGNQGEQGATGDTGDVGLPGNIPTISIQSPIKPWIRITWLMKT